MPDIVQKVKYTIQVDASELDTFKAKIDGVNTAIGSLNTAFRAIKTSVDKGLLSSITSLNTRLTKTGQVGRVAATGMSQLAAPLAGLQTSMAGMSAKFGDFNKVVVETLRELRLTNAELGKTKKVQDALANDTETSTQSMGKSWLRAFGVFQSAKYAIKQVWQAAKEGAQQTDLENVLGRQFDQFEATIKRAQELTQGTVGKGSLTRSFALMSSFGIPMDKFAENMELVQKMAIRTGQSADYLAESFARGISRLSPLILDNLGIQVSLGDANAEYAKQTGVLTTEMTKEQKTAALLNHVLEKLRVNTDGVSLSADSAAASINRAEAAWDDFWLGIKQAAGSGINTLDRAFQSQQSDAQLMASRFSQLSYVLTNDKSGLVSAMDKLFTSMSQNKAAADLLDAFDGDWGDTSGLESTLNTLESLLPKVAELRRETAAGFKTMSDEDAFKAKIEALASSQEGEVFGAQQAATAALLDLYMRDLQASKQVADQVLALWGDALTEKERGLVYAQQEDKVRGALNERIKQAVAYAKQHDVSLEFAIVKVSELTSNFDKYLYLWDELIFRQKDNAKNNEIALRKEEAKLSLLQSQYQLNEDLFHLKDGERLAAVDMNKVLDDRRVLEKRLSDLQKDVLEAEDDQVRSVAKLAQATVYAELIKTDALRSTAQASILADKQMLDSFKNMTKEKLQETLAMVKAQYSILTFSRDPLFQDRQALEREDLLNTIKILEEAINKPERSPGGGRGRHEKGKAWVDWRNLTPSGMSPSDDPNFIDPKWADVLSRLSIPGKVRPNGLLGDLFGDNFGSATPEDMKKAVDLAAELKLVLREVDTEEWSLDEIFSAQQLENMDIFNRRLAELESHYDTLNQLARTFDQVGVAMQTFRDGMDGLFGGDYVNLVSDLTSGFETFSAALKNNADAYGLVNAAMPGIRAFSQNLIKDKKGLAWVEALMQGAAAWAAYAVGNIPGGVMHTTAAAMYLAVAGGALRLPKGKSKDDKPKDDNAKYSQAKMRDVHLHIEGTQFMTDAERGVAIRDMMREAERAGL